MNYGAVAAGENGIFEDSVSGANVLDTIMNLRDTMQAGNPAGETDLVATQTALNHTIGHLVETGVDHTAIVTRLMMRDFAFFFQH